METLNVYQVALEIFDAIGYDGEFILESDGTRSCRPIGSHYSDYDLEKNIVFSLNVTSMWWRSTFEEWFDFDDENGTISLWNFNFNKETVYEFITENILPELEELTDDDFVDEIEFDDSNVLEDLIETWLEDFESIN